MNKIIVDELITRLGENKIRIDENMAGHTTFKVGGPADVFIIPENYSDIENAIGILSENNIPYFVLGNGSNLLVSDDGFRGAVIQLYKNYEGVDSEGEYITVKAGTLLSKVAKYAQDNSLTGMEFASGIPGTIGGAVVMNAGAYGGEMKQIVESVTLLDLETGKVVQKKCDEMDFGYRTSIVKNHPYIVLEAKLKLCKGNKAEIDSLMDELKEKRTEKQPLNFPSAGSTFKRPEGYFAGKLIEDSGLKGYSVGGAQVSEKHCGFVVNKGGASAEDIYRLIKDVQKVVKDKYNVMLEMEVLKLGNFETD